MPTKMKMRSVSVEDLGNIVKRMIDGVLEDNDQVAKLRQAVFKEYYFNKMEELKQVKAKIDADYNSNRTKLPGNIQTLDASPSREVIEDTNRAKRSESLEILSAAKLNGTDLVESANSEADVSKLSKSEVELQNLEKADEQPAGNFSIDEVNPSMVHVVRRQKYVKVITREADNQTFCNRHMDMPLDSENCDTSTNPKPTGNVSGKSKDAVNVQSEQNTSNTKELVEWWNRKLEKGAAEDNKTRGEIREIPVQFKSKGEIAFENWKKEKSQAYRRIFREEQKRKRLEQNAKLRQLEKKEAANQAYLYWRKQQDARQKLSNNRKRILAEMEWQKHESREKSRANSQAFKVWKRQKDVKLRERKMYMMAYSGQSYPQQQAKPQKSMPGVDVAFNLWLDQLDCVLHQKYLRERRYLVRSFYCQPAYFGTAAMCGS